MFRTTLGQKTVAKSMMLIMIMVFACLYINTADVSAKTSVKIAHAAHGEKGTTGCKPGDQTGDEVCVRSWTYSSKSSSGFHWGVVIRCKDPKKAAIIAKTAVDACNNDHVGYDKGTYKERQTFFKALKAANWDATKITKDVETSCTPFCCACINAAGISFKTDHSTKTLYKAALANDNFVCYTSADYCQSDKLLQPGDILLSLGHHGAIVATQSAKVSSSTSSSSTASSSSPFVVGKNYVLTNGVKVRTGAGTNYSAKTLSQLTSSARKSAYSSNGKAILKKGTVVTCQKTSGNWIKIPSGWICGKSGSKYNIKLESATSTTSTQTSSVKVKKGKDYKLSQAIYVRKGPGTNYAIKKRSELTASGKKCAVNTDKAKFKKGTVVTALEVKGNWLRCPSGWVCCKPGNVTTA